MKNIKKETVDDKRQFFRVDDIAYLSYRLLSWTDIRSSQKTDSIKYADKLTLKANLDRVSRELRPLYNVINTSNSNVAKYLSILDQKISLLSEFVLEDDEDIVNVEPTQVNIGGGGLSFIIDKTVPIGAILELKMKLLPEALTVRSYSKVVTCTQCISQDKLDEYKIAVEFEDMDDDVRDLITRHVLVREQALINRA